MNIFAFLFCSYSSKGRPTFTGPLAINNHLQKANRVFEDEILGPEAFTVDKEGICLYVCISVTRSIPEWSHRNCDRVLLLYLPYTYNTKRYKLCNPADLKFLLLWRPIKAHYDLSNV